MKKQRTHPFEIALVGIAAGIVATAALILLPLPPPPPHDDLEAKNPASPIDFPNWNAIQLG